MKLFLILFAILLLQNSFAQRQGIQGELYWVTGNQMPSPEKKLNPPKGVAREIKVYELTKPSDTELENGFIKKVNTKLVARGFSKANGAFKIRLAPGRYSVFVKEMGGLYANVFDGDNHFNPVTVAPKKYTRMTITINYQAVY